jgi:hypothetical protein
MPDQVKGELENNSMKLRDLPVLKKRHSDSLKKEMKKGNVIILTLNEPATTGRIVDRVEVKLDLTTDQ